MGDLNRIADELSSLTLMEASALVKALEEKWGVSAAMPVAGMVSSPAVSDAAAQVEEQTEFSVMLLEIGPNKINVIKEARSISSLGLKEAKELVESAPVEIKAGVSKEDAAKIKEQLEAVGAKIEVK